MIISSWKNPTLPTTTSSTTSSPEELHKCLEKLISILSDKERYVIEHRYAITGKKRLTLAKIGNYFGVTRERIRQVENYALQKLQRAARGNGLPAFGDFVRELLLAQGGIMSQERVIGELSRFLPYVSKMMVSELKLIICLDPQISRSENTINYYPHFRLHDITFANIELISKTAMDALEERKIVTPLNNLISVVQEEVGSDHPVFKSSFIKACLQIDKRIKIFEGNISLFSWRHINPKTLREKITYVLRDANRPLHFIEISEEITRKSFNHRVVNLQAVHNELINCEDFVLIGRGIYALREWGYDTGTVSEVIIKLLREKGALFAEQIIKHVLDNRQVKRVTISINLKNQDLFQRLADGRYALR